ncbi:MAG: acyl-ACP--UDP-N-acetylglucosamine O-acyltransferase [Bacteroidota bacterium]
MISPQAVVHPDAKVAPNVTIEPFAVVQANTEIGEGTWIGPHAQICEGARIGKNCKIYSGAQIASVPQDLKFAGEATTAVIGDNTTIREFVTVSRGTVDRKTTVIGNNCLIMAYCHIAHDCLLGNDIIMSNSVQLAGHITLDDYVVIGGMSGIHQFVHVGSHVMIAGLTKATKDIPPYVMAGRIPMSFTGVNSIGLRRRGFSNEQINQIQEMYRIVYHKGLNTSRAIDILEKEIPDSPDKETVVSFLRDSGRGIIRGGTDNA